MCQGHLAHFVYQQLTFHDDGRVHCGLSMDVDTNVDPQPQVGYLATSTYIHL